MKTLRLIVEIPCEGVLGLSALRVQLKAVIRGAATRTFRFDRDGDAVTMTAHFDDADVKIFERRRRGR